MYHSKFMTDIPWVLILFGGIALLRTWRGAGDVMSTQPIAATLSPKLEND
jgi:hypothetical protein